MCKDFGNEIHTLLQILRSETLALILYFLIALYLTYNIIQLKCSLK